MRRASAGSASCGRWAPRPDSRGHRCKPRSPAPDLAPHALPLYHRAQLAVFLGPGVCVGATIAITAKPTPRNLLPLLARQRITSFCAPPTVWTCCCAPAFGSTDLSALKKGYDRASIMPAAVPRETAERLPAVQLSKPGSCGRPVINVETSVLKGAMQDVAAATGELGEVVHRSPHLMLVDFHDDERSAAAHEGGWFHSGGLATINADGCIMVVDRHRRRERGGRVRRAAPHLAGFMAPKRVRLAESLPKNASGKLLKRELRKRD